MFCFCGVKSARQSMTSNGVEGQEGEREGESKGEESEDESGEE